MVKRSRGAFQSAESIAAAIAGLYARELQVASVSLDDNFFDVGGDSLMAESLIIAVQARFDVKLQTAVLLEAPTPRLLGYLIASMLPEHPAQSLIVPVAGCTGREQLVLVHGMSGLPFFATRYGQAMRSRFSILVMRGMGTEPGETPLLRLDQIVRNYFDALRAATGQVPQVVGGICGGAVIAVAMGRLAYEATGIPPKLIMIDPPALYNPADYRGKDQPLPAEGLRMRFKRRRFWGWTRDLLYHLGLGQTKWGRTARIKAFERSIKHALGGYVPAPFPCDMLFLASEQEAVNTVEQYRNWLPDPSRAKFVVLPGQHFEFNGRHKEVIDREILAFLAPAETRPVAAVA